jgi:3-isopropylmalate/(R)-2-methylmalate dehydratase small subunit
VPDPAFPLHRPEATGATVLVTRQNFGCGSSREHAVWAISQWGFRAVVAPRVGATPGFADIFRSNSYKNGLLPVEVDPAFVDRLFAAGTGTISIDLTSQTVKAELPDGSATARFEIHSGAKEMLLRGLDEIGLTLEHAEAITAYEGAHRDLAPVSTR